MLRTHGLPSFGKVLRHLGPLARLWPGTLFAYGVLVRGGGCGASEGWGCRTASILRVCCRSLRATFLTALASPRSRSIHSPVCVCVCVSCRSERERERENPRPAPANLPPQVFIFCGTTFLAARQLFLVAANLTTNELLLRGKYGYLRAADRAFLNPFDEGPAPNCVQVRRGRRGAEGLAVRGGPGVHTRVCTPVR